ncbi:MAG TPA: ATP-binding protein [Sphingomonas sp.]|jgi:signal transduction histidine kinase/ActR/RegA family two-component response regulator
MVTLVAIAILGAATLVLLVITVGQANEQRDRALRLQARSYDVMVVSRTLAGAIARSEAALGRYVISADRELGQSYFDQWRSAALHIAHLERMTRRDRDQQARIADLRTAYEERGEQLSRIASSTQHRKNSQALARYYQARNASSLAAIEGLLEEINAAERAVLDARTSAAMRSVRRSSTAAVALAVFGACIVLGAIALGWFTVRTMGERAVAEADADEAQARAAELTAAVEAATAELRAQEAKLRQAQKLEAVGQLTGGIAHDFNNMLAVVLGGIELARRNLDKPSAGRHLDSAMEGANRAAALTRRLLAFSREEGLKPEAIEPGALVAGMSDLLDRTLGDAITVTVRDEADGWRVHADRVQLENALLNLAVNARDAMNGRGLLTIATGRAALAPGQIGQSAGGDYVAFAVTDTGSGMTPDVVERVFEPFFTTKPVGQGTGLGLSQIFGFARQQGGEVGIDTAPGCGTTVTVYLPRFIGEDTGEETPDRPGTPEPRSDDRLRVLVVEDDPRVLASTVAALVELGHDPIACGDPLSAPALLDREPNVDLIVSDVLMPGQTGPEMVAGLLPRRPHLAVLYVTGYAGEAGATAFGGRQVLRKPFTLAGLERAIATTLAEQEQMHQLAAE